MPVLQDPAGDEPEVELLVWRLRRGLVRRGDQVRLLVGVAVELQPRPLLNVGVVALAIAPQGFFAVDHRPAQATHVVIGVKGREIMAMAAAETGIFLEQPLLDVEPEMLRLVVLVARVGLGEGELVGFAICEKDIEQRLAAVFGSLGEDVPGLTSSVVKRLENSINCHRSDRASPGASTSWCQKWVRRSAFPYAPSFSTHIAVGRMRSAAIAVTVG